MMAKRAPPRGKEVRIPLTPAASRPGKPTAKGPASPPTRVPPAAAPPVRPAAPPQPPPGSPAPSAAAAPRPMPVAPALLADPRAPAPVMRPTVMGEPIGRSKPPSYRWQNLRATIGRTGWTILIWFLFAFFVLGPLLTVAAFSITPSIFRGVNGFTTEWYRQLFSKPSLYQPLFRSFEVATLVVCVQLVLGTLVAYATARRRIFGAQAMDAMSNLTIALPSVVVGLAALSFYGTYGPVHALGEFLFNNPLAFTWTLWIVVFAHVLETFPYMVRTVSTVLSQIPPNLEMAARSLGAGRFTVFRTIVLPLIRPGLLAGGVLVFSRSIAEFGATIIVVSAVLKTSPIAIYENAEAGQLELAAAYSVVLMIVSFGVYLLMRRRILRRGLTIQ